MVDVPERGSCGRAGLFSKRQSSKPPMYVTTPANTPGSTGSSAWARSFLPR